MQSNSQNYLVLIKKFSFEKISLLRQRFNFESKITQLDALINIMLDICVADDNDTKISIHRADPVCSNVDRGKLVFSCIPSEFDIEQIYADYGAGMYCIYIKKDWRLNDFYQQVLIDSNACLLFIDTFKAEILRKNLAL